MNNKSIKNISIKKYNDSIEEFGITSTSALHWDDEQKQQYRFSLICRHLSNRENVSVLDVGCGTGDFLKHLNFMGYRGKYMGYDINSNLIKGAQSKYREHSNFFRVVDILEDVIPETFDYVILSGVFNANYGQDFRWIKKFVNKLYSLATHKVIFNALSTYVNFTEPSLFYINPLEIMNYIITDLSPQVTLEHGELPYNYQIIIDKQASWESLDAK